tara:strand:- start:200 stop:832 length:633 start_codon:yes stop_codon:yes gene_type:complete
MKITRKELRDIIRETAYEVISKEEDKRKKEREKLSKQRRRSMMAGLDSVARGIMQEEELVELVTDEWRAIMSELEEDRMHSPAEFKRKCRKYGFRTLKDFLKIQNLMYRSQKGDLLEPPKKQKEGVEGIEELNPCGNRFRDAKTGHFADKNTKGIESSYFCDGEPRKQVGGGKINEPDNCGRSSRQSKPSKDIPCHSDNKKLKGQKSKKS